MKFKGGKPRPTKPGQKQRKQGRPKGGVFLHKKGAKKAEKQRAAAAAAAAAGAGGAAATQSAGSKPAKLRPGAGAGLGGASGDADDFGHLLDDMPDYRPADEEGGSGGEGEGEGGSDAEQPGGGGGGGEGRPAKRRRKGGQKLSALEFEAARQLARQIADCSAEEQADWLWASYQQQTAASALERGGLTVEGVASLPTEGSLEERLKALRPDSWQQEFCGGAGGKGGGKGAGGERPPGSPSLLLVSPSAIGAVNLIKLCPQFNKACKIGKLFAKHFKVAEQEEVLRTQVMCLAAGTPNRLCKLADGGALKLDRLKHVVLDVNLDAKQRDILAIPETRADWWQFYRQHLAAPLEAGAIKLSIINSDDLRA
ncbi:hypothetical protein COHA_008820 [Chlorella ohadii]|uniref:Uncharacterized protein n=1 Tax=Chlorella ohadii TaxID=2649997 RepID=A0AAD5H238_9CHLO|nr:hypothetical protein COHA_008820 [Chlorella ohadii]